MALLNAERYAILGDIHKHLILFLIQILIPLQTEDLKQMDFICSWENQENENTFSVTNWLRKDSQMLLNEWELTLKECGEWLSIMRG